MTLGPEGVDCVTGEATCPVFGSTGQMVVTDR
jgi:hypothetical protein